MTRSEIYYTAEDVAEITQYTVETVWRRCRMFQQGQPGGWPHRRDGRSIRFTQDDIDAIDELMNPAPAPRTAPRKHKPLAA